VLKKYFIIILTSLKITVIMRNFDNLPAKLNSRSVHLQKEYTEMYC